MPTRLVLLIAILLCAASPARAAVVEGLYEAAVPVADQSAAQRNAALGRAMGAVLVKVTGRRDAATHGPLSALVESAPGLVQQYRYERRDDELHLWARFDAGAIHRALAERGVAAWARERPATLVWLAYDDGRERAVVDGDSPPEFHAAVLAAAERRGLPVILPLMDLEDRSALPFSDLWGGFDPRIAEASNRYGPNAVLVGRVHRVDAERWAARWTVLEDGAARPFDSGPAALDEVLAAGMDGVADDFAARFALMPTALPDGRTRLTVVGIERVGDYARVMRYLEGLSPVTSVAVHAVDGDEVTFALALRGMPQQLEQAIALGGRLVAMPVESTFEAPVLRYALRP